MDQIILKVSGGIVEPFQIPKDTEIVIRDYDIAECSDTPEQVVQVDEDGDKYVEIIFGDFDA